MSETPPPRGSVPRAVCWFAAGAVAFYLIGVVWKGARDEVASWPLYDATVVAAEVRIRAANQGVSNDGWLEVTVEYHDDAGRIQQAQDLIPGRPKQLREQREGSHAPGTQMRVRINPENPGDFAPESTTTWGLWIVATVVALVCLLNGISSLHRRPTAGDSEGHDDGDDTDPAQPR